MKLSEAVKPNILAIYRYVTRYDCRENSDRLLALLESSIAQLASLPERGHCPRELDRVGIPAYREILCKPYRVIYEISGSDVFVHSVLDDRRDLADLLHQRLVR